MSLSLGIVGLPNVGKSTLFNALTNQTIAAENYPFCTIDPNVGVVPVADTRLQVLADIVQTDSIVPAVVEFNDIAGLVKGAHEGEGLGNDFLGHIGMTNAIVHVIRDFIDDDVVHVDGTVDAVRDRETIETELILKDLDTVEKQQTRIAREARKDSSGEKYLALIHDIRETLEKGQLAITVSADADDRDLSAFRKQLRLLTDKPVIYVINGRWSRTGPEVEKMLRQRLGLPDAARVLPLDIKQEYELSRLAPDELSEFMQELGIEYTGLEQLTREAYTVLGLMTFFYSRKKRSPGVECTFRQHGSASSRCDPHRLRGQVYQGRSRIVRRLCSNRWLAGCKDCRQVACRG
ncbi:MAG: Ribosome-binding ATPase YchF [candidate division WS6 bacterium OLB20]|uniref:Ribosome-binding ATPase YchF n=1 Tax=candidate division WS6 bacterium OLB20 TaxID=1617426 RepID=A0A136LYC5_9BACT|nr:MAG: Ribosome-binding ATPase YchF [candidate division WS6 bacterium OLB20]